MQPSQSPASRRFRYRLSPVNMKRGLWISLGALAVLFVLAEIVSGDFFAEILQGLQEQPFWVVAMGVVATLVLIVLAARIVSGAKDAWLVVDTDGIRCSPHKHHGPRTWLRSDWQLPFRDIDRAVVERPGPNAHHVYSWMNTTLTLHSSKGAHRTALLHWDPVDEPLERPDLMALRPGKRLHALTESHPLIGHLQQRGIEVDYRKPDMRALLGMSRKDDDAPETARDEGPVDLMAFKSLIVLLGLLGVVGLAAAAHFMVLPPIRALWSPHWGTIALAGSLVFAGGTLLARAAPVRERSVVALMLALAAGGSWHPLGARIHSVMGEAPQPVAYTSVRAGHFQPQEPGYPALDLSDLGVSEYFEDLGVDQAHSFELQHLGDDRYILHLADLFERTRDFYSEGARE